MTANRAREWAANLLRHVARKLDGERGQVMIAIDGILLDNLASFSLSTSAHRPSKMSLDLADDSNIHLFGAGKPVSTTIYWPRGEQDADKFRPTDVSFSCGRWSVELERVER